MLCISSRQGISRESRVYQRYLACPQLFLQDSKDIFFFFWGGGGGVGGGQTEVILSLLMWICLYSKDILSNIYILLKCI